MGRSDYSHGKKVDKGTHTPLLKIFQEMMTREKDDPEKRNLLMEQKEDKKRRQYSGSRVKPECRSCVSSSSEHRKRGVPYKTSSTEQRSELHQIRPQSVPYQSEKKDSWWFWQNNTNANQIDKKQTEETCSCVSCVLKKLVNSEYACIGCLLLLFTISILVAFLVVFKTVPSFGGDCSTECPTTTCKKKPKLLDSERLKRKIEMLNENRMRSELEGLDEYRKNDKKGYDDALSGHIRIPGSAGIDFGPSFRELTSLDETENKISGDSDWSGVLDNENPDNTQSSDKLREFYKKLVQTDAKIKNLKKVQGTGYLENDDDLVMSPERSKRSLKLYNYPKRYVIRRRRTPFNKDLRVNGSFADRKQSNRTRKKRNEDIEDPTGFVIEKKKLIVQYKPNGIKKKLPVKKCSHAPKDSHTHENQLKHPFYQNTQRLDELLDRFLNKNLPEIMSDPFGLDMLFKPDKANKCKHLPSKAVHIVGTEPLLDQIPKPKGKLKKFKEETNSAHKGLIVNMMRPEISSTTHQYEKDFYHHEVQMIGKEKQKIVTASPNDFEVLLSVSTIMNPDMKNTNQPSTAGPMLARVPNLRRLMQTENEDEDNLGYEDFKEVLTDDMQNHDDMEKPGDRRKRTEDQIGTEKVSKINPPGVHNPNWKGPMPLYPDELSSMIRHSNMNKADTPETSENIQPEYLERKGRDVSDVEYVEDYIGRKYDRLAEMAQAYSDYGVLDGKKDSRNEKNTGTEAADHRVKFSADGNVFSTGLIGKLRKGRPANIVIATTRSERERDGDDSPLDNDNDDTEQTGGIRIEIRPTSTSKGTKENIEVLKILQKHIKIEPGLHQTKNKGTPASYVHSRVISRYPNMELVTGRKTAQPVTSKMESKKYKNKEVLHEKDANESAPLVGLSKGSRNLLSTDFKRTVTILQNSKPSVEEVTKKTLTPKNMSRLFSKFFQDFHGENVEEKSFDNTLERYVENTKQKNIKIYSTAHPDLSQYAAKHGTSNEFNDNPTSVYAVDDIQDNISTLMTPLALIKSDGADIFNDSDIRVTINRSEIKMVGGEGNKKFHGKISLTVDNPELGVENIDLNFHVPLVIDFNDEMLMMTDNMNLPNGYNQFEIYTEDPNEPTDQSETEMEIDFEKNSLVGFENETMQKRPKRQAESLDKSNNVTTTPVIMPANFTYNNTDTVNSTAKQGRAMNGSDTEMSLSDFFMMVSEWFKALEGVKLDMPRQASLAEVTEVILEENRTSAHSLTTEAQYPNYDSDMIENLSHRSRVLLSVENLANNNVTNEKIEVIHTNVTEVKGDKLSGGNVSNVTNSSTPINSNYTTLTTAKSDTNTKSDVPKREKKLKSKALFKRNADDSNLIFWNDMYDDEYGIQTDNLDTIRDKQVVKEKDFIKRSGRWVHDKIKKFAENLRITPHPEDVNIKERVTRSARDSQSGTYPRYIYNRMYNRVDKRDPVERYEEDYDPNQRSIFSALSVNMKEVCKKAARAVQETRHSEVKQDSKQGTIAASLMQQLVHLLTDLVDYQVQQKTCSKLPPDLQIFLEWLIHTKDEPLPETQAEGTTLKNPTIQEDDLIEELEVNDEGEKSTDHNNNPDDVTQLVPTEKHPQGNSIRAHYLDCLRSVQDLLDQYDDMSDEDKSKMTGVKSYLESQIKYLNKQVSSYDLYTLLEKNNNPVRFKRNVNRKKNIHTKRRLRRRQNKFIKKFGKKHTRTTASFDDAVQITDKKKKSIDSQPKVTTKVIQNADENVFKDVKRNLKDVYYKAIAEAKKYATGKNVHKKEEVTQFQSTTAKAP